jgi:hypothetical protein
METLTASVPSPVTSTHERNELLFRFRSFGPAQIEALASEFIKAKPFQHVVIDDFLIAPPDLVTRAFPNPDWSGWTSLEDAYQFNKRYCGDIDKLPSLFQAMVHELNGPSFLSFLERVTGIHSLIPDPYLFGGGLHSSGPGGILAPHADFHFYEPLELFRRLNLLIYFNPNWQAEYGGCLELYEKGAKRPTCQIVPKYGRMVVFLTDDRSIHGFTRPISGTNQWRNSMALYYYTSEETIRFSGDGVTYWQFHGKQNPAALARLVAYKGLLRIAGLFSRLAHRANPNFRPGARPIGQDR